MRKDPDSEPSSPSSGADAYERGRELYLAGDFAEAVPLLEKARRDPGERSTVEVDTTLSRALLFDLLLGTSFFMPVILSQGEQLDYEGGSPILFQHCHVIEACHSC